MEKRRPDLRGEEGEVGFLPGCQGVVEDVGRRGTGEGMVEERIACWYWKVVG